MALNGWIEATFEPLSFMVFIGAMAFLVKFLDRFVNKQSN